MLIGICAEKTPDAEAKGRGYCEITSATFALLQEVTKIGCKQICGSVTVVHTSANLDDYSVSSFYRVGLELGFIDVADMVPFPAV